MIKEWNRRPHPFYDIDIWYQVYKDYQKFDPRVVQVKNVHNNTFEMEYIEGENLKDCIILNTISFEQKLDIIKQVVDIVSNMFKFKHKDCHLFWHDDVQLKNFLYTTDNKIRLIDPDSFRPIKFDNTSHYEFEIGKFTNTINNLHMSLIK
tara:strand:- start:15239 stop:15688 length:450 start_codon:yes stop_codon:yes gene_type:complete